MNTFLPYPNYYDSLNCLDPSRLGNQIYRECKTLVNGGWKNHPASKMWRGYEYSLCLYALTGLVVLSYRGKHYQHHYDWFIDKIRQFEYSDPPPWLGREDIHSSHRSNLLRKDPEWYGKFGWSEAPSEGYVWPV